jgi:glutathione S-transferase
MYTLYIANKLYSSWSLRPWVLMTEKSIPFTEQIVPFVEGSTWTQYRSFSPNGRVPCLHDGEIVVWDSLSIVEYLAERHSGVWPTDQIARAWSRSAAAEMHSGFS